MRLEPKNLSPQEHRIIELIAHGKTNKEIAKEMGLAYSTVKCYVHSICQKLKVPNRTAAAIKYYQQVGPSS